MTKRTFLAGLLGAIAMFVWTSLAHMVLPLGHTGIKEIPNEQAILTAMSSTLGGASGFYFFPGMGLGPDATTQQMHDAMPQYEAKLLLVERMMPEQIEASPLHQSVAFSDLNMLVGPGGRERTGAEFDTLLSSAGFHLTRILPTGPNSGIIEGAPA